MFASFLNQYDPSKIMVVSARQYGQRPARMFAEAMEQIQLLADSSRNLTNQLSVLRTGCLVCH